MKNPILSRLRLPVALLLLFGATALPASELSRQRASFKHALEVAERAPLANYAGAAAQHLRHPLAPYLEYVSLQRQIERVPASTVKAFLERHPDLAVASSLRTQALRTLAKRNDWAGFRSLYTGSTEAALRCADLDSRRGITPHDEWLDQAQALWLTGRSQPNACDGVFQTLGSAGRLTSSLYLQRIELAANEYELGLIRHLARNLPTAQAALAQSYAAYLEAPTQGPTASWPRDARSRQIAVLGLKRLAQRDPGAAEGLLASLQDRLQLDIAQRGEVLNQIALWSAASYLPGSAARFTRVPASAWDERLHEWHAREALARSDYPAVLKALASMPATQRADARWRYLEARLQEKTGHGDPRSTYAALATEATYFGFLAAERIGVPYALCPLDQKPDTAIRQRLQARPGFVRAMELFAIGRLSWARREWDALKADLSEDERRVAVALASEAHWFDRGPFTLNSGDDLRYYDLRFPLPHERQLLNETRKYGLDPAWVAALIRAESAWAPDARSHANARGLMQLLPGTAQQEAKLRGLRYPGDAGLYEPRENLILGIAHLATMLQKHDQRPFLATAAYNAGPRPVARWLAQRPPADLDLWIETIPYRETREYVARILAFGAIYDWRLHGKAVPLMSRAAGQPVADTARRGFACPASTVQAAP